MSAPGNSIVVVPGESMTVWKYAVPIQDEFTLQLPREARVLHLEEQGEKGSQMWVLTPLDAPTVKRTFRVFGTGYTVSAPEGKWLSFIGTVQTYADDYVWHVFEAHEFPAKDQP